MKIRDLCAVRTCGNLYNLNRLGLGSEKLEKASALSEALKYIISGYMNNTYTDIEKWLLLGTLKREWFNSTIEYKEALTSAKKYLQRFQDYIMNTWEGEVIKENIPYSIPIDFEINGIKDYKIDGKIDYLIKKDNGYEAVILKWRKPSATYRARKEQNMVENQPELICGKLFLMSEYPKIPDIKISLYHMVGKEDKKGQIKGFEEKMGYNILSMEYEEEDYNTLTERLKYVLSLKEEQNCQNCYQREMCQAGEYHFRFPNTKNPETDAPKPKKAAMTATQKIIATHQEGIMNVIAVPGAGKTFTIVQRVKKMIGNGINPSHILLITFTRKACSEIKERLACELETAGEFPIVETFNSWGYGIIRNNPKYFGKKKLAGSVDKYAIILSLLGGAPKIKGVSYEMLYGKFGLVKRIEKWFSEIDDAGEDAFMLLYQDKLDVKAILYLYKLYKMQFANAGYIEYNDQIALVDELFNKHPEIAELYAKKHRYIIVDEYQDVNKEQVALLKHLVKYNHNLLVVGDDDQSIYSFRGSDSSYMLNFRNIFPDSKTVIMADNFRSNDKIITASNAVIKKSEDRYEKEFIPHITAKNKPLFIKEGNIKIAEYYIKLFLKKYKAGEIAILARNNKELFSLSQHLSKFVAVNAPKDYIREDAVFILFKNVLQIYLCGLKNKISDKALFSLFRSSGITLELPDSKEGSLYEKLMKANVLPSMTDVFQKKHLSLIEEVFIKIVKSLNLMQYSKNVPETLSNILGIWDVDGRTEHPVVNILTQLMEERNMTSFNELYSHMQNMVAFEDATRIGYEPSDAVNLLTAHDSKGKEFPVVVIYGTNDFRINEDGSDDRRLLYVAMTRAKQNLIMLQFEGQNNGLFEEIQDHVIAV